MENANDNSNEQNRTRSPSPSIRDETQRDNEERFNRLQDEMSSLKAMMEKLLEQNNERVRQVGTAPNTSAFSVQTSNMVTGVNRTRRRNFQDYEDEEDFEDSSRNSTETASLHVIQDLPRRLQKSNDQLLQRHVPIFRVPKNIQQI